MLQNIIIVCAILVILFILYIVFMKEDDETDTKDKAKMTVPERFTQPPIYINPASDSPSIPTSTISEINQNLNPGIKADDLTIMTHGLNNEVGVDLTAMAGFSAADYAAQEDGTQENLLLLQNRKELNDRDTFIQGPRNEIVDPAMATENDARLNTIPESILVAQRVNAGIVNII